MSQKTASQTHQENPATALVAGAFLQRKCDCGQHTIAGGECGACEKNRFTLQRATRSAQPEGEGSAAVPPIVHDVLNSPGQPLDVKTRAFFEPRFGYDFSGVRVHTDGPAARSASAVNALAYTLGTHVVFGTSKYAPGTNEGRRLLAHELTHVVEQREQSFPQSAIVLGGADSHYEVEARSVANNLMIPHSSGRLGSGNISQDTKPAIRRWSIGGNIAQSEHDNESLGELARKVGMDEKNWKCIKPIRMRHFKPGKPSVGEADHYEKFVRARDKFDISNLTTTEGGTFKIHLFKNGSKEANAARHFYPDIASCDFGGDACIQSAAHEGRAPIKSFLIFGHQSGGRMYGEGSSLTPIDLNSELPRGGFDEARAGLLPLPRRCWFTRDATARSVGCTSVKWGQDFAAVYLRKGTTITTTLNSVASACSRAPTPGQECLNPDQLFFLERPQRDAKRLGGPFESAAAFHGASTFWATMKGDL